MHEKRRSNNEASKASKLANEERVREKSESFLHSLSFIEKTFTIFRHGKKGVGKGSANVYYPSEP